MSYVLCKFTHAIQLQPKFLQYQHGTKNHTSDRLAQADVFEHPPHIRSFFTLFMSCLSQFSFLHFFPSLVPCPNNTLPLLFLFCFSGKALRETTVRASASHASVCVWMRECVRECVYANYVQGTATSKQENKAKRQKSKTRKAKQKEQSTKQKEKPKQTKQRKQNRD
jgi:hypothetical protein